MKDLEMNWSRLDNSLKEKVLSILVDNIFVSGNYDFKNELLKKLNISNNQANQSNNNTPIIQANQSNTNNTNNTNNTQMNEGVKNTNTISKETFGEETKKGTNIFLIILILILLLVFYYFFVLKKKKVNLPYQI
jgi:preprotein translocase subunit SecF